MHTLAIVVAGIYTILLFIITVFSLGQLQLLLFYRRNKRRGPEHMPKPLNPGAPDLPMVTVQLPVYNEMYVMDRLIDCICSLEYPKDRLEIQVLDDSTDESIEITAKKVAEYQAKGFLIEQIRREDRKGFKAGALSEGLKVAKGEFIAIFDADFLPHTDFLLRMVPYFLNDPKVGVVQTRWEHLNQRYSMLTRLQAFQLDVHFTVEQMGRFSGDCLLQFNGTGGMWRRTTIDDAGGWEADTLTEDLDLSYRAQLKDWKIEFVEAFTSPGELPAEMNGFKSQQFRWMKGGAETARKMLPVVWNADIPLSKKVHASLHLLGSTLFVTVFLMAMLNIPLFFLRDYLPAFDIRYLPVFYASMAILCYIYYTTHVETLHQNLNWFQRFLRFAAFFPLFTAMNIGMSLHNTVAVVQGWMGKKSAFVRTPKFNIVSLSDSFKQNKYLSGKLSWVTIAEGLLAMAFFATFWAALMEGEYKYTLFQLMYAGGFMVICVTSIRHLGLR
jgi:cellulose synthase/poly-beta-1,6-N-acetylglucosamine synthase-like glycosyltransferase